MNVELCKGKFKYTKGLPKKVQTKKELAIELYNLIRRMK